MGRTTSGHYEVATQTPVSVLVTSTAVLSNNRARQYAYFINDSANIIYLVFGPTAVASTGIRLNANGGVYEMSFLLGNMYQGQVTAIALTGTSTLLVTEGY